MFWSCWQLVPAPRDSSSSKCKNNWHSFFYEHRNFCHFFLIYFEVQFYLHWTLNNFYGSVMWYRLNGFAQLPLLDQSLYLAAFHPLPVRVVVRFNFFSFYIRKIKKIFTPFKFMGVKRKKSTIKKSLHSTSLLILGNWTLLFRQ